LTGQLLLPLVLLAVAYSQGASGVALLCLGWSGLRTRAARVGTRRQPTRLIGEAIRRRIDCGLLIVCSLFICAGGNGSSASMCDFHCAAALPAGALLIGLLNQCPPGPYVRRAWLWPGDRASHGRHLLPRGNPRRGGEGAMPARSSRLTPVIVAC